MTTREKETEKEKDESLPDLADGTESKEGSQEFEEEATREGTIEVTPVGLEVSQSWGLLL
jgi:hypothetical protein